MLMKNTKNAMKNTKNEYFALSNFFFGGGGGGGYNIRMFEITIDD